MKYSFKDFQKQAIIRFLALDKYNYIKSEIYNCNVSTDKKFQTKFNAFYRVRRDEDWRKVFYDYFESIKNNKNIQFEDILKYLYDKTGNIEASFSSKLLSTINPDMPIWDQYVLKNLGLEVKGKDKKERFEDTIKKYYEIVEIENKKLQEVEIQKAIKDFKTYFIEYDLSDIKILDYILWNSRDEEE